MGDTPNRRSGIDHLEKVYRAPADTADPYIVGARRRIASYEEPGIWELDLGSTPYFITPEDHQLVVERFGGGRIVFIDADASEVESEDDLLALLGRVYDFPDYYGGVWEAYLDCYSDVVEAGDEPLYLTIWGLENFMRKDFRAFMRSIYELELTTEMIGVIRPVVPRKVVNLYPGDWPALSSCGSRGVDSSVS